MKSQNKSDKVFRDLKKDILECRLLPSARIKIKTVCTDYGVSLGAAREALSRLAAEGMVCMETQKGFSVAPVSWTEFAQLFEARAEIETFCLDQAIRHGDLEWETQVAAALHRLSRLPERDSDAVGQPSGFWLAAHTEFHRALVAACPNRCMLDLREMLYSRSERYRHWAVSLCLTWGQRDVRREHKEIADFVLARDSRSAQAAMHEHFMRTSNDLLAAAQKLEASGEAIYPPYRQQALA